MAVRDVYEGRRLASVSIEQPTDHDERPAGLRIEVPARADRLADVRSALRGWLRRFGASDELVGDVLLAVDEACSNSVEHAYAGGEAGMMTVSADRDADDVRVVIEDFGSWRAPAADDVRRGRGVQIMRTLTTHCDVRHGDDGTQVRLTLPFRGVPADD